LPSLTQDPRFGSQADQQTDKESNPHPYNSIGTKSVDYGLGANPIPAPDGIQQRLHANILEQPERLTVQPGPLHLTRRQDLAFRVTTPF
jgi:hypothetical protein